MKINNLKLLFICIAICQIITIVSCSKQDLVAATEKQLLSLTQTNASDKLQDIKKLFVKKKLAQKLNPARNSKFTNIPDWRNPTISLVNDGV